MSNVIDLDALVPPSATIRFKGKEMNFKAPSLEDVLKVAQAAEKLGDFDEKNMSGMTEALHDLNELFWKLIPDLKDEELTMEQLLVLVRALSDMVTPPDVKELAKQGITVGVEDDTKKKDEVTPDPSPTS